MMVSPLRDTSTGLTVEHISLTLRFNGLIILAFAVESFSVVFKAYGCAVNHFIYAVKLPMGAAQQSEGSAVFDPGT